MEFQDQTFTGQTIQLDFNSFERCTFENCVLVYAGVATVSLRYCIFRDCQWVFNGPAARTFDFVRRLYSGMGLDRDQAAEDFLRLIEYEE